jgi:hypothetical protein
MMFENHERLCNTYLLVQFAVHHCLSIEIATVSKSGTLLADRDNFSLHYLAL